MLKEKLLSGNEVAKILQVSRSWAYLLMQRGDIPTGAGRYVDVICIGFKTNTGAANVLDIEWLVYYNSSVLTR